MPDTGSAFMGSEFLPHLLIPAPRHMFDIDFCHKLFKGAIHIFTERKH